ncbi:hypothetical protein ATN83_1913 [Raoultella ornithinolytica]|jgi:hypothetical protein|nr:hypothetical protein ATN83_1913 [Raoultella ornithinolytica]
MVGGVKRGIDDLVPFIRDADLWPEAFAGHLRAGLIAIAARLRQSG